MVERFKKILKIIKNKKKKMKIEEKIKKKGIYEKQKNKIIIIFNKQIRYEVRLMSFVCSVFLVRACSP